VRRSPKASRESPVPSSRSGTRFADLAADRLAGALGEIRDRFTRLAAGSAAAAESATASGEGFQSLIRRWNGNIGGEKVGRVDHRIGRVRNLLPGGGRDVPEPELDEEEEEQVGEAGGQGIADERVADGEEKEEFGEENAAEAGRYQDQ
jgi:hypothetical protein